MAYSMIRSVVPLVLICVLGGALAACSYHKDPDPADLASKEAANAAADAQTCQDKGLQPNTPAYNKCLDQAADARERSDFQDRANYAGRLLGRSPYYTAK
jgi:hypothetical protein